MVRKSRTPNKVRKEKDVSTDSNVRSAKISPKKLRQQQQEIEEKKKREAETIFDQVKNSTV